MYLNITITIIKSSGEPGPRLRLTVAADGGAVTSDSATATSLFTRLFCSVCCSCGDG